MGARDAGWIQVYSENTQEAYDNLIQAVRIAEHPDVQLPVMVCMDGFITVSYTHLDVYKRQLQNSPSNSGRGPERKMSTLSGEISTAKPAPKPLILSLIHILISM